MAYRIETFLNGYWDAQAVGRDEDNRFATEEEAETQIDALRELGDEWASAEYRVVEIEAE
jgi:hypothetical protein